MTTVDLSFTEGHETRLGRIPDFLWLWGLLHWFQVLGLRVQGVGFRVQGLGFRSSRAGVQGLGVPCRLRKGNLLTF